MAILEGAVVFVDDEYAQPETHANEFYRELCNAGRPIAAYDQLPDPTHMEHWDGLALAVLDWNLRTSEHRAPGATTLGDEDRRRMVNFLVKLLDRYFCPIFIVSTDSKEQIEEALRESSNFPDEAIGVRIRVVQKEDVNNGFIETLEQEVKSSPALSVLRTWDQQYQRAKNRMFIDLGELSADWPAHLVAGADLDKIDPGYELLEALNANVRHRMDPASFDLAALDAGILSDDGSASRKVRFGRSVLRSSSLHASEVMPGDFFSSWREKSDPSDAIWLNLTPACYTVRGRRKKTDPEVRLHLIRGVPEVVPTNPKNFDSWERELRRSTRHEVVHVLHDDRAYKFDFQTLQTFAWSTVEKHRIGRLLAPFITQVQQRHVAYLASEGLPRVLPSMYKVIPPL